MNGSTRIPLTCKTPSLSTVSRQRSGLLGCVEWFVLAPVQGIRNEPPRRGAVCHPLGTQLARLHRRAAKPPMRPLAVCCAHGDPRARACIVLHACAAAGSSLAALCFMRQAKPSLQSLDLSGNPSLAWHKAGWKGVLQGCAALRLLDVRGTGTPVPACMHGAVPALAM